jgi:hypothetical protein
MAKRVYKAERTSSFMRYDQGNRWVVIEPNGLIYNLFDESADIHMTQNEAIRLAKELNEKQKNQNKA